MHKTIVLTALSFLIFMISISQAETVYFLVGSMTQPELYDSYVLPLTESNDIEHARDIIQYGTSPRLVVAYIAAGTDDINRDYFNETKHRWSWHVTGFIAFASMTAEIYDGDPTLVEKDVQWWITNTGGRIGFWRFTVIAELGTDPKHWNRDFVRDSKINYQDFTVFAQNWSNGGCVSPGWCNGTDLNKNGIVDFDDLEIFCESWLSPYAAAPLWFSAWNCPYQCHGDADCAAQGGAIKYRVSTNDLAILNGAKGTHYGDTFWDPRADFNHDGNIDDIDTAILSSWYNKTNVPADCPTTP